MLIRVPLESSLEKVPDSLRTELSVPHSCPWKSPILAYSLSTEKPPLFLARTLHQLPTEKYIIAAYLKLRERVEMKRTTLNYWTDALAFIGFLCLTTSGILLRYQLPPGSGRLDSVGGGRQAQEKAVSILWGLTRHEWGDIHYYIAIGLMAVLAFHIVLHWKWIVCVTQGKPVDRSGYRLGLGVIGLLAVVLLSAAPLLSPAVQIPRSTLQNKIAEESHIDLDDKAILGDMTLEEVEAQTKVPITYILEQLDLPPTTSPQERLGRLKRQQGFQMKDVRSIISGYEAP